jgi:TonB family protein
MKQKIIIMKNKPELTDEEIRSYMDFENLVARTEQVAKSGKWVGLLKFSAPVLAILGVALWLVLFMAPEKVPVSGEVPAMQPDPPEIRDPAPLTPEEDLPAKKMPAPGKEQQHIEEPGAKPPPVASPTDEKKVAETDYIQAEPVTGYSGLYDYFNKNLVYPAGATDSVAGVQTITFTINPAGRPEDIQFQQSLGKAFDDEARRLIQNMPLWKPATLNGKAVPSRISIPLTFQFERVTIKE